MIKRAYSSTKSFLASLLFPRVCIGCGREGRWICGECLKTIDIIKQPFCPECRQPTNTGEFCDDCKDNFKLDGIFICANFDEGILKEAIHQFKYNHITDIGGFLGRIMAGKLKSVLSMKYEVLRESDLSFNLIVPVPLHKKRLRQRGFNQAEILSRQLSRIGANYHELVKPILAKNVLVRKKYTISQAELDREQRLDNLKDVFVWNGDGDFLRGKNILLVDDVTTTGATLEECAKMLKQNGAKSVWGIVLAKGK